MKKLLPEIVSGWEKKIGVYLNFVGIKQMNFNKYTMVR